MVDEFTTSPVDAGEALVLGDERGQVPQPLSVSLIRAGRPRRPGTPGDARDTRWQVLPLVGRRTNPNDDLVGVGSHKGGLVELLRRYSNSHDW